MKLFKLLSVFVLVLALLSCENGGGETPCFDEETGLSMTKEACEALHQERAKRKDAEEKAKQTNIIQTGNSGNDASEKNPEAQTEARTESNPVPGDAGEPEETPATDIFEDREHGFRLRIPPRHAVYRLSFPETPTQFTSREDTLALFGISVGNPGPGFLLTVENVPESLRTSGIFPKTAPFEGGLTDDFLQIAGGRKGYIYSSNALGFVSDPHVTVFAGKRIYYLRHAADTSDLNPGEKISADEISPQLREFAKGFGVLTSE